MFTNHGNAHRLKFVANFVVRILFVVLREESFMI